MPSRHLLALALAASTAASRVSAAPAEMSVCVFFDGGARSGLPNGRLHAVMLINLLGHFREVEPRLADVESYSPGSLTGCERAAYVGSDFQAAIPAAFLSDVMAYERGFLWINYGIDRLQKHAGWDAFREKTGFTYMALQGADSPRDPSAIPDFFRHFEYKGERFSKLALLREGRLVAATEIALVRTSSAKVLSYAVHSGKDARTPYVTERRGFYYVADNPFLYIHQRDRYLILADVLFDVLGLAPRQGKRYAVLRIEDVHARTDVRILRRIFAMLKDKGVPFTISLIPRYVGPGSKDGDGVNAGDIPEFMDVIRAATDSGGEILLHGYEHHARLDYCPTLPSGADYEFWDRCRKGPLPYDSEEWVLERLNYALALMRQARLKPIAWVTPHYAASAQDFETFGRTFARTLQRVVYSAGEAEKAVYVTQFFPYTIYRDAYGQFVWPENLGYIPMPGTETREGEQTSEQMLEAARLSRSVRDAWASFFWHPQLAGGEHGLERFAALIDGIRGQGYEFVSLARLRDRGE